MIDVSAPSNGFAKLINGSDSIGKRKCGVVSRGNGDVASVINKSPFTADADCRETLRKVRASLESGWDNDLSRDVDIARFMLPVPDRKQCGGLVSINRDCRKKITAKEDQERNE